MQEFQILIRRLRELATLEDRPLNVLTWRSVARMTTPILECDHSNALARPLGCSRATTRMLMRDLPDARGKSLGFSRPIPADAITIGYWLLVILLLVVIRC